MSEDRQRYENVTDRTGWPAGPWDTEPLDKAVWTDDETGYPCMIRRGPMGAWCGYVGVTEEHPAFGKDYSDLYDEGDWPNELTFAGPCDDEGDEATAVCHIPAPGESDKVWWFGFDNGHAFDIIPGMLALDGYFRKKYLALDPMAQLTGVMSDESTWHRWPTTYKTETTVRQQVTDTAKVLAKLT
jgi:hypothetical protein